VVYTPLGGGCAQLELSSTFRAFTLEIISQVALGLRPEQASVFPALFEAVLDELNQRVLAPWRGWVYPRLQREHAARLRRLNDIVYGMIAARRAAAEAAKGAAAGSSASAAAAGGGGGEDAASDGSGAGLSITGRPIFANGADMLDMMLDSAPHLTDTELADEVKTQLLAGHETSSMMLTWAMYLLAAPGNEAAMARAVAEADAVLGTTPTPSFRDYKNLEYVGWVLNEAMRLYSPVPLLNRESSEGDTLGGYAIPAGTAIIVSIWALHKNPAIWGPDAEAFRPERFSPEESRGRHAWCFLPFSQGPRNCIGQHLAVSEAKVVLGELLRRFTITLAPGQEPPQTDAFVIPTRPQKPLFVNLTPRPGKRF
jgi:cytochrome P450